LLVELEGSAVLATRSAVACCHQAIRQTGFQLS
jgi:hypothetical protein